MFSKKMFLKISQNSQENTCAGVPFLIKFQVSGVQQVSGLLPGLKRAALLKKRLWYKCFPMNFVKFLRTLPVAPSYASNS